MVNDRESFFAIQINLKKIYKAEYISELEDDENISGCMSVKLLHMYCITHMSSATIYFDRYSQETEPECLTIKERTRANNNKNNKKVQQTQELRKQTASQGNYNLWR